MHEHPSKWDSSRSAFLKKHKDKKPTRGQKRPEANRQKPKRPKPKETRKPKTENKEEPKTNTTETPRNKTNHLVKEQLAQAKESWQKIKLNQSRKVIKKHHKIFLAFLSVSRYDNLNTQWARLKGKRSHPEYVSLYNRSSFKLRSKCQS